MEGRVPKYYGWVLVSLVQPLRKEASYDDQESYEENGGNLQVQKLLLNFPTLWLKKNQARQNRLPSSSL